jgi:hypothetical protein
VCISADRLAVLSGVLAEKKEIESVATGRTHHASSSRPGPGHLVSFNSRELGSGDVLLRYRVALSRLRVDDVQL